MTSKPVNTAVLKRSLDADFYIVMKSVGFKDSPREVVTIKHMQAHYSKAKLKGRDVYGD